MQSNLIQDCHLQKIFLGYLASFDVKVKTIEGKAQEAGMKGNDNEDEK